MRRFPLFFLLLLPPAAFAQEKAETREMVGQIGSRTALMILHEAERPDGGWRVTGEYLLLQTFTRRFLEGERSPQLGVMTLREGTSAILFGRPATGELRGTLRDGQFRGMRYGPGGQERERFEFSEEFPSMEGYAAQVRCDAGDGRYASTLSYTFESGRLKGPLEWRSRIGSDGHRCTVRMEEAKVVNGGVRLANGACAVVLRDLGDHVKVSAENCAEQCGSEAYLEPLLVDRRGGCRLLRPEPR